MLIANIVSELVGNIFEDRIESLIRKREDAILNKDYDRAWKLQMKIDKNKYRLIYFV